MKDTRSLLTNAKISALTLVLVHKQLHHGLIPIRALLTRLWLRSPNCTSAKSSRIKILLTLGTLNTKAFVPTTVIQLGPRGKSWKIIGPEKGILASSGNVGQGADDFELVRSA